MLAKLRRVVGVKPPDGDPVGRAPVEVLVERLGRLLLVVEEVELLARQVAVHESDDVLLPPARYGTLEVKMSKLVRSPGL